ncbi:hypothetical protein HMPREF0765_4141 [Sphingobacterium spiritivorum ATCC 33300]|uniref:Uncharacterized protein n=1 Tax=Sphingobacterium spiritivorum ATCC 33300 TaxID=525372 RepID=C2G3I5_SPHSI|nr:hypothetical protein [Sphingobacterium spiritivorum]EEI90190.1 hypothetical protein HMPREF0765_4141 [Sphingobacterium spiritivorum ATCC 33300]QQS95173.1 hypothetical protein I6J03_17585 [Sphingobacterium spiritivorum]
MKKKISKAIAETDNGSASTQAIPQSRPRSGSSFTQVDDFLSVIRGLGIPTADGDVLEGQTDSSNAAKIVYNTTLHKLRVYNPANNQWRDAVEADLSDYYTKEQLDNMLTAAKNRSNHTGKQAISTIEDLQTFLDSKIPLSQKAVSNGVATLDVNAKLPMSQVPEALIGSVNYKGNWNPASNTPALSAIPESDTKGHYYISSVTGTFNGIEYNNGDWIISNGSVWGKVDNTNKVVSINGKQGAVILDASDVGATPKDSETLQSVVERGATTTRDITLKNPYNNNRMYMGLFGGGAHIFSGENTDLRLGSNDLERVKIKANGFVGIGTDPVYPLDVNGVIAATGGNSTEWNAKAKADGSNATGVWGLQSKGLSNVINPERDYNWIGADVENNITKLLAYHSNGYGYYATPTAVKEFLGIPQGGETFASVAARGNSYRGPITIGYQGVNSNTTKLNIQNSLGKTWSLSSGTNNYDENSFGIYNNPDGDATNLKLAITASGNVGIGEASPQHKLEVNGTVRSKNYSWHVSTTTPVGVVTNESSIRNLPDGADFGYGISTNVVGGLDIMANQEGQPIRFWSGGKNSEPLKTAEMRGRLTTFFGNTTAENIAVNSTGEKWLSYYTNNTPRFLVGTDGGVNGDSDFRIYAYKDDGSYNGNPLRISRANGEMWMGNSVNVNGIINTGSGNSNQWNDIYNNGFRKYGAAGGDVANLIGSGGKLFDATGVPSGYNYGTFLNFGLDDYKTMFAGGQNANGDLYTRTDGYGGIGNWHKIYTSKDFSVNDISNWNQAYNSRVDITSNQTITGLKTFFSGIKTKDPSTATLASIVAENSSGTGYTTMASSGISFRRGNNYFYISPSTNGSDLLINTPTGTTSQSVRRVTIHSGAIDTTDRTVKISGRAYYDGDYSGILQSSDLVPKKYVDDKMQVLTLRANISAGSAFIDGGIVESGFRYMVQGACLYEVSGVAPEATYAPEYLSLNNLAVQVPSLTGGNISIRYETTSADNGKVIEVTILKIKQ